MLQFRHLSCVASLVVTMWLCMVIILIQMTGQDGSQPMTLLPVRKYYFNGFPTREIFSRNSAAWWWVLQVVFRETNAFSSIFWEDVRSMYRLPPFHQLPLPRFLCEDQPSQVLPLHLPLHLHLSQDLYAQSLWYARRRKEPVNIRWPLVVIMTGVPSKDIRTICPGNMPLHAYLMKFKYSAYSILSSTFVNIYIDQ